VARQQQLKAVFELAIRRAAVVIARIVETRAGGTEPRGAVSR
jgi:hypothetical protein